MLIEYYSSIPEWMVSWPVIAILIAVTVAFIALLASLLKDEDYWVVAVVGCTLIYAFAIVGIFTIAGQENVSESERERVAVEVSRVSGVEVDSEDVRDMLRGEYVEGVGYVKMTDDSGDRFLKVEERR